jgi:excisionase family DNA binding protein
MERLLLRPEEAAEVLAIGRNKLFELLASGELESVRLGGSRRVPLDGLVEFVARLRASNDQAMRTVLIGIDNEEATRGVAS